MVYFNYIWVYVYTILYINMVSLNMAPVNTLESLSVVYVNTFLYAHTYIIYTGNWKKVLVI